MKRKGFTLIEVIVVIAVFGALVSLSISGFRNALSNANETRVKSNVVSVQNRIQENTVQKNFSHLGRNIIPTEKSHITNECDLYNANGRISQSNALAVGNSRLKKINDEFVEKSGVKDDGLFFTNEGKEIFYCKDNVKEMSKIKSGTVLPYALWDKESTANAIEGMGLNTINLSIRVETSSELAENMTVNEDDLDHAVELARSIDENTNLMLEPFLWIDEGGISEVELNPKDVDLWFYQWKNDVLLPIMDHFEKNEVTIDYYTVASNYVNIEYAHGYWQDIFRDIKSKFDMNIAYRTNWWVTADWDESTQLEYKKKLNSPLLTDENLDLISVAAYFELTEQEEPTIAEIKSALRETTVNNRRQNVHQELMDLSTSNGKQVFFGELGAPSIAGYATEPWNDEVSDRHLQNAHYNYFKSYIETFWDEKWFAGFSIFGIGDDESLYDVKDEKAIDFLRSVK